MLDQLYQKRLPRFVDECLAAADWQRFDVVGLTSMFQQQVASLALAARIKLVSPGTLIVFGGANVEGEMGLEHLRAFADIDIAIVGEGDEAFPNLLHALDHRRTSIYTTHLDEVDLPGVAIRCEGAPRLLAPARPFARLDDLPPPDYTGWFARRARVGTDNGWCVDVQAVPVETSRGCWWGTKHHCTFCGLNGAIMGFRSKSPGRVREELDVLAARHGYTQFEATDNILDVHYLRELFPILMSERLDFEFFFEVKANLTLPQLRIPRQGGVRWIQPGIESMSTHILRLMRKGTTALQNVRLLKWARYLGLRVSWNLLWGFPGEVPEDYENELAFLRTLTHLEPPDDCGRIWLERFSPYWEDRARFGMSNVRPEESYRFVYPAHVDLEKVAYFFDYTAEDTIRDEEHQPTVDLVADWSKRYDSATPDYLRYRRTPSGVFIDDRRACFPV